jgi:hypothetical protein
MSREQLRADLRAAIDDANALLRADGQPIVEAAKRRKRRPTVAAVVQQLKRAGVEVAGVKLNPDDGTVTVLTGKPDEARSVDDDGADMNEAPIDRSDWH